MHVFRVLFEKTDGEKDKDGEQVSKKAKDNERVRGYERKRA